jgi:hypothetical protein
MYSPTSLKLYNTWAVGPSSQRRPDPAILNGYKFLELLGSQIEPQVANKKSGGSLWPQAAPAWPVIRLAVGGGVRKMRVRPVKSGLDNHEYCQR